MVVPTAMPRLSRFWHSHERQRLVRKETQKELFDPRTPSTCMFRVGTETWLVSVSAVPWKEG